MSSLESLHGPKLLDCQEVSEIFHLFLQALDSPFVVRQNELLAPIESVVNPIKSFLPKPRWTIPAKCSIVTFFLFIQFQHSEGARPVNRSNPQTAAQDGGCQYE